VTVGAVVARVAAVAVVARVEVTMKTLQAQGTTFRR
jgi:hypothetical protein